MSASNHSGLALPKGRTRKQQKASKARSQAHAAKLIRAAVFIRERGICRCCRLRPAESRHEIVPRSLGGKITLTNCIAVCGDGTRKCHSMLQTLRIRCEAVSDQGAEGTLLFKPMTQPAMKWLEMDGTSVRILVSEPYRSGVIAE